MFKFTIHESFILLITVRSKISNAHWSTVSLLMISLGSTRICKILTKFFFTVSNSFPLQTESISPKLIKKHCMLSKRLFRHSSVQSCNFSKFSPESSSGTSFFNLLAKWLTKASENSYDKKEKILILKKSLKIKVISYVFEAFLIVIHVHSLHFVKDTLTKNRKWFSVFNYY